MAESEVAPLNKESTSEEESGHSSNCLSLQYSSFPFEGHSSTSDGSDVEVSQSSVVLYLYEPEWENGSEAESGASSYGKNWLEEQLLNPEW